MDPETQYKIYIYCSQYTDSSKLPIWVCGKLKIGSNLVLKKPTVQKFNIHSDGFTTQTACNSDKNNFSCI